MALFKKKANKGYGSPDLKETSDLESAASLNEDAADDKELVAVIMASLMNFMDIRSSSNLKIRSIRRIGRNTPVWNNAGRDAYIASKL